MLLPWRSPYIKQTDQHQGNPWLMLSLESRAGYSKVWYDWQLSPLWPGLSLNLQPLKEPRRWLIHPSQTHAKPAQQPWAFFSFRRFLADHRQTLRASNGGWKPGWALDVLETIFHVFIWGVERNPSFSMSLGAQEIQRGAAGSLELIKSKQWASAVGESLLSFIDYVSIA